MGVFQFTCSVCVCACVYVYVCGVCVHRWHTESSFLQESPLQLCVVWEISVNYMDKTALTSNDPHDLLPNFETSIANYE